MKYSGRNSGNWLTTAYNQNVATDGDSVAMTVERETLRLLRDLFALPEQFEGVFVSGATQARPGRACYGTPVGRPATGSRCLPTGTLECAANTSPGWIATCQHFEGDIYPWHGSPIL